MMRNLYQDCRLVHGDLSEYNLLYFEGQIVMIDVSQSVEHDHPMALDFLRRDCAVMNDFFRKNKVYVLTTMKLFNYVTSLEIKEEDAEQELSNLLLEAQQGYREEDIHQDKVFEQVYIPRSLLELSHVDIINEEAMGIERFYDKLTGLKISEQEEQEDQEGEEEPEEESDDEKDSSGDEGDDEEGTNGKSKTVCLTGMTKE
jgi:RIO kinase 1